MDHKVSEEAIHQIWSRFLKDLSRYTQLVPSSLLFDTPRAMSYKASFRPNVVAPFYRLTTCGPKQLHTKFGQNTRTTSIPAGPISFTFSHFTIQNFILQFEQRPPPFAVHSIKLIIDTTQCNFFPFEGGPSSVRGSHTPNLVQIFKGLVTLYSFSPFQFTIRHTTAPCRIQPVSDQTW